MRILQVSSYDEGGGAEAVARGLHNAYRHSGHQAWLAVGRRRTKIGGEPATIQIPAKLGRGLWGRACLAAAERVEQLKAPGAGALRIAARPKAAWARWRGHEDFDFPATGHLCELPPARPDVLHCHNLYGYFDLRSLPSLSRHLPVVLTLHDCWTMTGHCAHPFGCERWQTGCGSCPDLTIPPAVRRDATADNWRRKREIYEASRLNIAVPSKWLKERAERAMLSVPADRIRVIPNGIDDRFFTAPDRDVARRRLDLPSGATILLFAANTVRNNIWKDFRTLRLALGRLMAKDPGSDLRLIALGESAPDEVIGETRISFVPFHNDPNIVALYYRAADIYLHASRAETFSLTIAEAMACGLPVVATDVGAVAERVASMAHRATPIDLSTAGADMATGILVAQGDAEGLAEATATLIGDADLRQRLGSNAQAIAAQTYRIGRQARAYLDLFEELIAERNPA